MPELSIIPNGLSSPPIFQPRATDIGAPPPAPVPDLRAAARAQGRAALFTSIAKALETLPGQVSEAYEKGRKMQIGEQVEKQYQQAVVNPGSGDLANFTATSEGNIKFAPQDAEIRRLQLQNLSDRTKTPYEKMLEQVKATQQTPIVLPSQAPAAKATPGQLAGMPTADALNTDRGALTDILPPADFQPVGKNGSQLALSTIQPETPAVEPGKGSTLTEGFEKRPDGTVIQTLPGGIKRAWGPGDSGWTVIEKPDITKSGGLVFKSAEAAEAAGHNPKDAEIDSEGNLHITKFVPPGVDPNDRSSAALKTEAARMGIDTTKMTAGQIAKAMEEKQITEGVIPPHLLPQAGQLARLIVGHPSLKHYPTIREAKEAVDAGLANPDTGGFSDMALVEGFQRMVNPGATVRSQTIQSMMDAAGWLQKLDPTFQWSKAVQGDKFTGAARERIKKLADDIFDRATKNAKPQLNAMKKVAKSYGIANPDAFVDNVLVMSPLYDAGGEEVPSGTPHAQPSGLSAADTEAVAWVKANPTNPLAAQIKASLQARGIAVE